MLPCGMRIWTNRRFGLLGPMAVLLLTPSLVLAANRYWSVTSPGDWSDGTNWGGTEPGSGDYAYIINGGTATIGSLGESCTYLRLGGTGSGTVQMVDGSLSASYQSVGQTGVGTFIQSGGTNTTSSSLYLGYSSSGSGFYELTGATSRMNMSREYIGFYGSGTLTQSGGMNWVNDFFYVGGMPGANGTYELSGSGYLKASSYEYIGDYGTGTFAQSGGTNTTSRTLYLGHDREGKGSYSLDGLGLLSAAGECVGYSGEGTFTHSGGTNSVSSSLYLGYNVTGAGDYCLTGTGYLQAANEYVGYAGSGTLTQSGGTNTVSYLAIGANGVCTLSGGVLNVSGGLSNEGVLDLSNGSVSISASSSIVDLSTALTPLGPPSASLTLDAHSLLIVPNGFDPHTRFSSFRNDGLTHQLGSSLTIPSTYSIKGIGTITDFVHCEGTISATWPGVNLTGGLDVPPTGKVDLRAGSFHTNGTVSQITGGSLYSYNQYIGTTAAGTLTQSGGNNSAIRLEVGPSGVYALSAGTLSISSGLVNKGVWDLSNSSASIKASSAIVDLSNATLSNSAGVSLTLDARSLLIVAPGFDPQAYFPSYSNAGLVHESGSTLTIPSGRSILGSGEIVGYITCQGTLSASRTLGSSTTSDWRIHVYGGLNVTSYSGRVDLKGGSLYINDAISGLSAGELIAGNQYVGATGTATFTQPSGINVLTVQDTELGTVDGILYLGYSSTGNGTYRLSGTGELHTGYQHVGYSGTGTFTQSGGNNGISDSLNVGYCDSGRGTYQLSAGQLSSVWGEFIGYSGTGTLTQSGGTNSMLSYGSYLYLGYKTTGNGTYTLSGTALLIADSEYIGYSGTGTFLQSGGTNSLNDFRDLYLGYDPTGNGSYDLSSGSLSTHYEYVGESGTGKLTQSGGTNSANVLYLGDASGGSGVYELSAAGRLLCTIQYVGGLGSGTITQSGGTNSAGSLCLGEGTASGTAAGDGTYQLSNGCVTANEEWIGHRGSGTFTQSGGTNSVSNQLVLANESTSDGTYNLAGGVLALKSLRANLGAATFNFGGGTLRANGTMTCSLPMVLTGINGNANIDTAGYAGTISGSLSGGGGLNKLGSGRLTLTSDNSYSGDTSIRAGTLALAESASIGSSPVIDVYGGASFDVSAKMDGFELLSSQILEGAGTVTGSVVACPGSHIRPGSEVGTLRVTGDLTLSDGALLDFELGALSNSDLILMTGLTSTLYLDGQEFSDFGFTAVEGFGKGTYRLIDAGAISGSLSLTNRAGIVNGCPAFLAISGTDLVLTVVPEPSTLLLLTASLLGLLALIRRQKQGV
jgi:autotransporter-associated beta strand protein